MLVTNHLTKYAPMLAKTGKSMAAVANKDYILEEKLDGIRCIAYCTTSSHMLINRSGVDITNRFPEVMLPKQWCVLDGELCCYSESSHSDFQAIQTRMHRKLDIQQVSEQHPAVFVAFDCLEYKGFNTWATPYNVRSSYTETIVKHHLMHSIQKYDATLLTQAWLDALCANGAEGVIAKLITSRYAPGLRSNYWFKFKGTHTATYEVLGATYGTGKRESYIGALLIGHTDESRVTTYLGKVGTGFDDATLRSLSYKLYDLSVKPGDPTLRSYVGTWPKFPTSVRQELMYILAPQSVYAKVKYRELTSHGVPRFPVYVGLDYTKGVLA